MNWPVVLRTAATAVVAGLGSAEIIYPHQTWIIPVVTALAAIGIHSIPAASQGAIMTEQPLTGPQLMGLGTPAPAPAPESAPEPIEPVFVQADEPVYVTLPAPEAASPTVPSKADLLREAIALITEVADRLEY